MSGIEPTESPRRTGDVQLLSAIGATSAQPEQSFPHHHLQASNSGAVQRAGMSRRSRAFVAQINDARGKGPRLYESQVNTLIDRRKERPPSADDHGVDERLEDVD